MEPDLSSTMEEDGLAMQDYPDHRDLVNRAASIQTPTRTYQCNGSGNARLYHTEAVDHRYCE